MAAADDGIVKSYSENYAKKNEVRNFACHNTVLNIVKLNSNSKYVVDGDYTTSYNNGRLELELRTWNYVKLTKKFQAFLCGKQFSNNNTELIAIEMEFGKMLQILKITFFNVL